MKTHPLFRTYMTHGQVGLSVDQYNANADFHVPKDFTKLTNEPIMKAPHLNGYVLFFTNDNDNTDIRYLVGQAKQVCYRDRGHNVACSFMHRGWDHNHEGVGGGSAISPAICPSGYTKYLDTCGKSTSSSPLDFEGIHKDIDINTID